MNQNAQSLIYSYLNADQSVFTKELVGQLHANDISAQDIEFWLRKGRPVKAPSDFVPGKLSREIPLTCDHVNYDTHFFLYLPRNYQPEKPSPLLVIGHGGNGNMSKAYARQIAFLSIQDWISIADQFGFILVAPMTEKGWGNMGYAIVFSLISKIKRWYSIDPDRVYITGHSMGGHLSWRSALALGDRFGAVSPMSGGYDYVARDMMPLLWNVPGYATFGSQEPYQIDDYNRKMRTWIKKHGYNWIIQEKPGGHEIFFDELPRVAGFFLSHPRNLYPAKVWGQGGRKQAVDQPDQGWQRIHYWNPFKPIPKGCFHWLRIFDRPDLREGEKQKIVGEIRKEENAIHLISSQVRKVRIYLHPHMINFSQPVRIMVNGETLYEEKPHPDPAKMLYTIREFDDWGRIFYTWIDLEIHTDRQPEIWGTGPEPGDFFA
ncbi:MAG: hypothetical protein KDD63_01430 [Bacteroidetes bacterium]|nr:hypothetical protein [Bacteroidota bacterium]